MENVVDLLDITLTVILDLAHFHFYFLNLRKIYFILNCACASAYVCVYVCFVCECALECGYPESL